VLFLRLAESGWQRIFIEAGVVFWQSVEALDSPDQDRHHYTLSDLGAVHGLDGRRIIDVITADLPAGGELRLLFSGDACVSFRHVDGRSRVIVEPAGGEGVASPGRGERALRRTTARARPARPEPWRPAPALLVPEHSRRPADWLW
jgi:hypothetical protein